MERDTTEDDADLTVRQSEARDEPAIVALYPRAFPDEDLVGLVRGLLRHPALALSLVASRAGELVGHIAFTQCQVADDRRSVALLGPIAVSPDVHRRGVGTVLINAGFAALKSAGVSFVFVLGDPAYYARFGFEPEERVLPPYALPNEWTTAWRSLALSDDKAFPTGQLRVPDIWDNPALWGPEP